MNALRRLRRKPVKAIRSEEPSLANRNGRKQGVGSFGGDVQRALREWRFIQCWELYALQHRDKSRIGTLCSARGT